jgi:DNA-binding MarR family transcriptional regulator
LSYDSSYEAAPLSDADLPQEVLAFIQAFIDRLETLEVLRTLHADPTRSWTTADLSDHLRSSVMAAELVLERLVDRGLVRRERSTYRFEARTEDLQKAVRDLLACYRERRTAVITAIFSRPTTAIQSFADAFRIKKGGA